MTTKRETWETMRAQSLPLCEVLAALAANTRQQQDAEQREKREPTKGKK